MIEVEQKFSLTPEQEARLIQEAEFLGEKKMEDRYYDTPDYSLTTQDTWLRWRNGNWELKVPVGDNTNRHTDFYNELETEPEIRIALKLATGKSFEDDLAAAGYAKFASIITTRRKYKKGNFNIDLDSVRYEDGGDYALAEIELMVDQTAILEAQKKIEELAKVFSISLTPPRGKVLEYLYRKRPDHYQALKTAGVLRGREG